jgi:uncharacterized membrane protein YqgA involved in biofilm formation
MPVGIIVNSLAILLGGLAGALLGEKIPKRLGVSLPLTFGLVAMGLGVNFIVKISTLPAVVLALVIGSTIGELIYLEKRIEGCANLARGPVERLFSKKRGSEYEYGCIAATKIEDEKEFMGKFIGILILVCTSSTGIIGALKEGMTGDHSILLAKSILDFFSVGIFAATLGYLVITICIPQIILFLSLFFSAALIMPATTPVMISDFTACGGFILLATGLRICGIKAFPVANMLPALIFIMPISYFWTRFIH